MPGPGRPSLPRGGDGYGASMTPVRPAPSERTIREVAREIAAMSGPSSQEHLSRISTLWGLIHQAHGSGVDAATAAQRQLMQRYCGAAYHYLLGAVRDEDVAMDLFQEFALRFVRGDFLRADPG